MKIGMLLCELFICGLKMACDELAKLGKADLMLGQVAVSASDPS